MRSAAVYNAVHDASDRRRSALSDLRLRGEDLAAARAVFGSAILDDARTVLGSLTGSLDTSLIERELRELARDIPDHDVVERWRRVQQAGPV